MEKASMSSFKAQVEKYGTPISDITFQELREYATNHNLKLSGFKNFVGDINTIKTVINDIVRIAEDFPRVLDEKDGIWLELDYNLGSDFATTDGGHIIHLNGGYFADVDMMNREYLDGVKHGRFVKWTDWRAIARHEVGHVVANIYQIKPMVVAQTVWPGISKVRLLERIETALSLYSAEYEDGREIISESFSAYYSNVENEFAEQFISRCQEVAKNEII